MPVRQPGRHRLRREESARNRPGRPRRSAVSFVTCPGRRSPGPRPGRLLPVAAAAAGVPAGSGLGHAGCCPAGRSHCRAFRPGTVHCGPSGRARLGSRPVSAGCSGCQCPGRRADGQVAWVPVAWPSGSRGKDGWPSAPGQIPLGLGEHRDLAANLMNRMGGTF